MHSDPARKKLLKRIAQLERQAERYKTEAIKYRTLFNSLPHGITVSDTEGNILETNSAAEQLLGVDKDQHEKRKIDDRQWRIIRPDGSDMPPEQWPSVRALKENRTIENCEMGIFKSDDEIVWINVTAAPLKIEGYGVVVIYSDITKSKHAVDALRKSEKNYKDLVDTIPYGIEEVDLEGRMVFLNNAYHRILGYAPNELLGTRIWDHDPTPESRQRVRDFFEYIRREKPPPEPFISKNIRKDGGIIDVSVDWNYKYDEEGRLKGFIAVVTDITDKLRAEKALKESEREYKNIAEKVPGLVLKYKRNIDGRDELLYLSKGVEDFFGVTRGEALNYFQLPRDRINSNELNNYLLFIKESAGKKTAWEKEHRIGFPGGKTKWIHARGVPSKQPDGSIIWHTIGIDITIRKDLEAMIRKTQKLESMGILAGGIAHDFNNILFPIIGLAEMLMEDLPPGGPERESAEEIFKAGKRGAELCNQILSFSRESEHKLMPTQIRTVIKEIVKLSRAFIPSNIQIHTNIQKDCGMVMADPSQIHQIGINIITNAYHAVEKTGGKISITLRQTVMEEHVTVDVNLSPGAYVVFSVSDTGHGMSEELIGRIFDPYFTTKEQGKGTGLGLAVVYGIVKEHKGAIKVYSELGKGSTFDVYLPLLELRETAKPADKDENYRYGNERILLVDDEKPVIRLERQILEKSGYEVTSCLSAVEALEMFMASPDYFDLMITDMAMPSLTGTELAEKIWSVRPDFPIIICSGFSDKVNEETAESMGIKGYLGKPVLRNELTRMVHKVLDEAGN